MRSSYRKLWTKFFSRLMAKAQSAQENKNKGGKNDDP